MPRDRLLQRFHRVGALSATILLLLAGCQLLPVDDPVPVAAPPPAKFDPIDPLALDFERLYPVPLAPPRLLVDLSEQFSLEYTDNARIRAERNWFVSHPDYLNRVFTRAQRYLPHIVDELEQRELPMELALLPIVESAYDPFAYSHGRASGLWQMIPGTATRFGIRQNWWYDGRRDIVDSTRAALEYLEYLHKFNEGDWFNAIASYNSGEGNVRRAKRRNEAAGKPTDFFSLRLSKETSAYVPRLLALVDIVKDPQAYGLDLPYVVDETQFAVVDIGSQIDLALAAELAAVDVDTVYAYNPGYNRWSTDPQGPHSLVMPVAVAENFKSALATVPEGERVRWKRHKVKNGETISEIALDYHTTIAAIKSANNLRGNTIRAGHHLMIPVASKPLAAYSQSADARLEKTQNRQRAANKIEHVVANGESFWTISRRYGVSTRQLAAWNGMAPGDTLPVGRKLVVWTNAEAIPTTSPTQALGNTTRKVNYTVRSGDSLSLIATRFRVSVNQIVRWNNIDKNKILRPGQRLTMYVDVTRQSS
ncbi:MAG: LysM peptidoglycan-binding domain-containing protein [Pseudomonadota bacterium]